MSIKFECDRCRQQQTSRNDMFDVRIRLFGEDDEHPLEFCRNCKKSFELWLSTIQRPKETR